MAFQVKDLMLVLAPSAPLPTHLTCGPLSEDEFDCAYTADTGCANDSAHLVAAPDSKWSLHQLRQQLANNLEHGSISLN